MTETCDIGNDIPRAARLLREGQLVAFGTETVYGLGANALDVNAVAGVFEAKGRPTFDPLIMHVADRSQLVDLVQEISPQAELLMDRFWPGPMTIVLPKTDLIPDLVTAGLDTVAVRIPAHESAQALLQRAAIPVAAPSANLFGQVSPTTAQHVADQLGDRSAYIVDGGPCGVGVESTVIDVSGTPTVLRLGGVTVEDIEAVIGPVQVGHTPGSREPDESAQKSPGMLTRHYSPRTPLEIVGQDFVPRIEERVGLLTAGTISNAERFAVVEQLSSIGDLAECAANFFAAVRRLDARPLDRIVAHRFPNEGLGRALNDRLERAASRE